MTDKRIRVLSLHLKKMTESLIRPVRGNEFQTNGAENRKARLEKSVFVSGWTSSGMAGEWIDADTLRGSES